jgi:hypothetical protein
VTDLERQQRVHAAVREFYLALPGRTAEGWAEVRLDPDKFNKTWRKALGLEVRGEPPPEGLRGIDPATGEDLRAVDKGL